MINKQGRHYTYVGAHVFGDDVREILLRSDAAWSDCAERLMAVGQVIRSNEVIIADCKSTLDRVERLLQSARALRAPAGARQGTSRRQR